MSGAPNGRQGNQGTESTRPEADGANDPLGDADSDGDANQIKDRPEPSESSDPRPQSVRTCELSSRGVQQALDNLSKESHLGMRDERLHETLLFSAQGSMRDNTDPTFVDHSLSSISQLQSHGTFRQSEMSAQQRAQRMLEQLEPRKSLHADEHQIQGHRYDNDGKAWQQMAEDAGVQGIGVQMQNPEEQRHMGMGPRPQRRDAGYGDAGREGNDWEDSVTVSGQRSDKTNFSLTKQLKLLEGTNYIEPKLYQQRIFEEIANQWWPPEDHSAFSVDAKPENERFGAIVFMPTGSGKTLIAVMLILKVFGLYDPVPLDPSQREKWKVRKQSDEELAEKNSRTTLEPMSPHKAKVAFIVPTTNLVEQQADAINQITPLRIGKYSGNHQKSWKQTPGQKQYNHWRNQLHKFDVFVFTQKKLYDTLMHGLLKIDEFHLIVFDECHHTDQSHYYNLIMQDFFFYKYEENRHSRPLILGLTASPIKQKVDNSASTDVTEDIKDKLQKLADNLYSKYVCISERHINELEKNQARVRVEQYKFDLQEKIEQVEQVAEKLIRKLLKLIPLDEQSMKISNQVGRRIVSSDDPCRDGRLAVENMDVDQQINLLLETFTTYEFKQQQDEQVVKFLKKRYELISLDIDYVKAHIDIRNFLFKDDKILLLYCIILLKNANNLILELGPYSFVRFVLDTQKQLLDYMKQSTQKSQKAQEIVQQFMQRRRMDDALGVEEPLTGDQDELTDVLNVSEKVKRLISILNEESRQSLRMPKVIVFVKDRVVAEYLNKILNTNIELRRGCTAGSVKYKANEQELLDERYVVSMAMSPKGKNLVNRAYRSTRSVQSNVEDDSTKDDSEFLMDELPFAESLEEGSLNISTRAHLSREILEFRSMLSEAGSSQSGVTQYGKNTNVRISSQQLKDVLTKFKKGDVNVLIATNVIEEGLDVSECNLVICLNELLNVKAFIQMKGRARQFDSKFIFLCADAEYQEVERERKNFTVVIDKMKELAFGDNFINSIQPQKDILKMKKVDESEFFEIAKTGARVSLRDAKSLIEVFCKAAEELEPAVHYANDDRVGEDGQAQPRKLSKYVQDLDPYYKSQETTADNKNRKYYLTSLYMPKTCARFLFNGHRFNPENGFIKKKDSENHVAQLALKQLYENAFLDEYLFPMIGPWAHGHQKNQSHRSKVVNMSQSQSNDGSLKKSKKQKHPQGQQLPSNMQIGGSGIQIIAASNQPTRKRTNVPSDIQESFRRKQQNFDKELKQNKSKFSLIVEDEYRSLVKSEIEAYEAKSKSGRKRGHPKSLFIHCLKASDSPNIADPSGNNEFPFKTSNEYLGILYDRSFEQAKLTKFWMFQEKRQKDKNAEYLEVLQQHELIDEKQAEQVKQGSDLIQLDLSHRNLVQLDFAKMPHTGTWDNSDLAKAQMEIFKLKFFHTWIFYYFYCADCKLIKNIVKLKFDFAVPIFEQELTTLYRFSKDSIHKIFCRKFDASYLSELERQKSRRHSSNVRVYPFVCPLKAGKDGRLAVNWRLIDDVIEQTKGKLLDIMYVSRPRHIIRRALDVEESRPGAQRTRDQILSCSHSLKASAHSFTGVWDDLFTGVRYVKLQQFQSHLKWGQPIMHLESHPGLSSSSQQSEQSSQSSHQSNYTQVIKNFEYQPQTSLGFGSGLQDFSGLSSGANQRGCPRKQAIMSKKLDIYSIQRYNFDKFGLLLQKSQNKQLFTVRKERHFVDFSKIPKPDTDASEKPEKIQFPFEQRKMLQATPIDSTVSSRFDAAQQLVRKSVLSYDQYQTLQQACTHLLYFNEFLQVERFITEKFRDFKCYLQPKHTKQRAKASKQSMRIDLGISQQKEMLQSDLEPSAESLKVFQDPNLEEGLEYKATDQILKNIDLIMVALTAPNANRNYDYERLEFYGDSVISFLVILELFVTKNYSFKEGPLDFFRIQQVSNMNFFEINRRHLFYKYMINEPQTIFNDFVPGAFEGLKYQGRIKHKALNELDNKIKFLQKDRCFVEYMQQYVDRRDGQAKKGHGSHKQPKAGKGRRWSEIERLENERFLTELRQYLMQYGFDNSSQQPSQQPRPKLGAQQQAKPWPKPPEQQFTYTEDAIERRDRFDLKTMSKKTNDRTLLAIYDRQLRQCIQKLTEQKKKKIEEIDLNYQKIQSKKQTQQKHFFYKQLADVVESVTGAATIACGINLTQSFLRKIGVLNTSQSELKRGLRRLKRLKESNLQSQLFVKKNYKDEINKIPKVEGVLGYEFKNKLWLVEALTHKSFVDQSPSHLLKNQQQQQELDEKDAEGQITEEVEQTLDESSDGGISFAKGGLNGAGNIGEEDDKMDPSEEIDPIDDYERLEFLGDAVLNFLIAQHFYRSTVTDEEKKMPKELHKMKTSVINNALLSLIVIENRIHEHILYNDRACSFRGQFEKYVQRVQELLDELGGSTREVKKALDLDSLYEYSLKIFGDVFESLIGAVFIDSEDITVTWNVLYRLMEPYIGIYSNLKDFQDHSRTKLLELWNQKPFMKNIKCHHETRAVDGASGSDTRTVFRGLMDEEVVLEITYEKEAKNKVRSFYRHYYDRMSGFFAWAEKQSVHTESKEEIIQLLRQYLRTRPPPRE